MKRATEAGFLKFPAGQDFSAEPRYQSIPDNARRVQIQSRLLRAPLTLNIEQIEEGQFLVSDELLCVYGVGDDVQTAAEDLLQMLVDLHRELSSSSARLSSRLREQLRVLDYYLGRRFDQHHFEG